MVPGLFGTLSSNRKVKPCHTRKLVDFTLYALAALAFRSSSQTRKANTMNKPLQAFRYTFNRNQPGWAHNAEAERMIRKNGMVQWSTMDVDGERKPLTIERPERVVTAAEAAWDRNGPAVRLIRKRNR